VIFAPSLSILKVGLEVAEKVSVKLDLPSFELMPCSIRGRLGYAVIDVSQRDFIGFFIIEYSLKR